MKIILEGPDGIGKSTLADYISKKYDHYIIHSTSQTENTLEYHNKLLSGNNVILDRANLGEIVYPIIYNREPKMSWIEQMTFMLTFKGIYIIFYASDFNDLKERLHNRGDTEEILKNARLINNLYKLLADMFRNFSNVYIIDISKEKDQIKWFEEVLNEINTRSKLS